MAGEISTGPITYVPTKCDGAPVASGSDQSVIPTVHVTAKYGSQGQRVGVDGCRYYDGQTSMCIPAGSVCLYAPEETEKTVGPVEPARKSTTPIVSADDLIPRVGQEDAGSYLLLHENAAELIVDRSTLETENDRTLYLRALIRNALAPFEQTIIGLGRKDEQVQQQQGIINVLPIPIRALIPRQKKPTPPTNTVRIDLNKRLMNGRADVQFSFVYNYGDSGLLEKVVVDFPADLPTTQGKSSLVLGFEGNEISTLDLTLAPFVASHGRLSTNKDLSLLTMLGVGKLPNGITSLYRFLDSLKTDSLDEEMTGYSHIKISFKTLTFYAQRRVMKKGNPDGLEGRGMSRFQDLGYSPQENVDGFVRREDIEGNGSDKIKPNDFVDIVKTILTILPIVRTSNPSI